MAWLVQASKVHAMVRAMLLRAPRSAAVTVAHVIAQCPGSNLPLS
jgi:hypothetical protein